MPEISLENKLDWTRRYHALGWSLFPVTKNKVAAVKWRVSQTEKAPLSELLEYVKNGYGLSVVTGAISGVCVIDDDNPKLPEEDRYNVLGLDSLIISKSPSGSTHYYFADWGERNKQIIKDKGRLINIDLRGEGGQVLLPPFFDREWVSEPTEEKLALLPGKDAVPEKLLQLFENSQSRGESYRELVKSSIGASEYRNPILFEFSKNMWLNHFNGYPGNTYAYIKETIHAVNAGFQPPKSEKEVEKIIEQGYQYARRIAEDRGLIVAREVAQKSLNDHVSEQLASKSQERFNSGYSAIDSATGGFEYSNTYLIAGLEKSGKSSLLMKMLQNKLEQGVRIGYVNTEMPALEFASKMAAYATRKQLKNVTDSDVVTWTDQYSGQFEYLGVENMPARSQIKSRLEGMVSKGVRALVFDNITSWGNKLEPGKEGWQVMTALMDDILAVTKRAEVVSFAVMHTKNDGVVSLKNMKATLAQIKEGNYTSIFEEAKTVVGRPSLSSVYGGGGMLSQISGGLLIWRPFQKVDDPLAQQHSRIIIESFRYAPSSDVECFFHGEYGVFSNSIVGSDNEHAL